MKTVPLSDIIEPAGRRAGLETDLPVYSVTKHVGFVPSLEYFKKRVFSRDVEDYKLVEPGDFAYATIHLDEGSIGIAPERGLISPMYTVFKVRSSAVDPTYLIRFLKSPGALAHYAHVGKGAVHRRKSISLSALGALPVPLPPLAEQRRIASILDLADALRVKRRETLDHYDSLTRSIFTSMFGDPVRNEKGLKPGRLEEALEAMQYGPRFYNETYTHDGVRIVRITDLDKSGSLDFTTMPRMACSDEEVSKYALHPGDIIFARTGATVGKLALISSGDPECIAGAYFIRIRLNNQALPDYVAAAMRSRSIQAIVWAKSQQSAQQNFSGPGLRALPLPIPPIEMQQTFTNHMHAIRNRIDPVRRAMAADNVLFAALQSHAFRGKL